MARAFRERVLQSGDRLVVSELSRLDAPASNLPGKLAAALHGAPVGSVVTGSAGVAISILLGGGKVEQFPIARVNEKAIQVLDQALPGGWVPLGLVEDPGTGEDLAAGVDLALFSGFLIAQPDDAVGDLSGLLRDEIRDSMNWGLSRNGVKNYSKGPCVTFLK